MMGEDFQKSSGGGYWWAGWNTQADGNGINYWFDSEGYSEETNSVPFSMPASNVTLYAKWVATP